MGCSMRRSVSLGAALLLLVSGCGSGQDAGEQGSRGAGGNPRNQPTHAVGEAHRGLPAVFLQRETFSTRRSGALAAILSFLRTNPNPSLAKAAKGRLDVRREM